MSTEEDRDSSGSRSPDLSGRRPSYFSKVALQSAVLWAAVMLPVGLLQGYLPRIVTEPIMLLWTAFIVIRAYELQRPPSKRRRAKKTSGTR